jgi:integrase
MDCTCGCARPGSDEEIAKLWHADSQHVPLLKFLLLTSARIGEAQRASWAHIHGDRWVIPAEHAKNGKETWVALSRQALRLLSTVKSDSELVFGRCTNTGTQAWLHRWCEREEIEPAFTPHDLRRTVATRLNELGVMPHVVDKVLESYV